MKTESQGWSGLKVCGKKMVRKIRYEAGVIVDNFIEGETNKSLSFFIFFSFVVFFILIIIDVFGLAFDWKDLGTFGDFLGGVANPIFSFITFLCLVLTIIMQRKELSLSRQELELTRNEYSETKDVIWKQSVETTFYNGINLHHEITKNIKISLVNFNINRGWLSERDLLSFETEENVSLP